MPAMPKKAVLSAAATSLASQALPALAVVDERLNGDGTGLIFGVNDESLGFILLLVPTLIFGLYYTCLLYTSPSPRDATLSRMPSSA